MVCCPLIYLFRRAAIAAPTTAPASCGADVAKVTTAVSHFAGTQVPNTRLAMDNHPPAVCAAAAQQVGSGGAVIIAALGSLHGCAGFAAA